MTARDTRSKYWLGEIVYLTVRDDPVRGVIVGVTYRQTGVIYEIQWGYGGCGWHYEIELSKEYVPDYVSGEEGDGRQEA